MSLRFIFAGIVLGVFIIFGTAIFSIQRFVVFPAFLGIEQDAVSERLQTLVNALNQDIQEIDNRCRRLTSSVDFERLMHHKIFESSAPRVDASSPEAPDPDLVVLCDADGRIRKHRFRATGFPETTLPPPLDAGRLPDTRPLLTLTAETGAFHGMAGIDILENRLMFVAASPIPGGDPHLPPEGVLILGRWVPENRAHPPGGMEITFSRRNPIAQPDARSLEIVGTDDVWMEIRNSGEIHVAFTMNPALGNNPVWLHGVMPRNIAAKGAAAVKHTLYTLLVVGLMVFVLMLMLVKKAFLTPVAGLTQKILEAGESGALTLSAAMRRKDEIGFLAAEFKRLYQQLKDKTEALEETNRQLETDIASRKAAEKALSLSEYRHRLLIENLPQKIIFKDRNSVYITCNDRFAKGMGLRRQDIEGKTDRDLIPEHQAEKFHLMDRRVMASGRPEETEEISIRNSRRRVVHTLKVPVRDEQGDIMGVLGILSDITERRAAEEALRQQTAYMTALHETAVGMLNRLDIGELLGIIMLRASEFIRIPNGALYLYVPEDDVLEIRAACGAFAHRLGIRMGAGDGFCGHVMQRQEAMIIEDYRTWERRLNETELDQVGAIIGVPLISGTRTTGVISLAYVNSNEKIEPEIIPYLEQFAKLASIAIDNARLHERVKSELAHRQQMETERRRIEDKLRQAQKMESVGTLAGGIAHDFNNLLMGIQGRISLMMLETPKNTPFAEHLAAVESIVNSASELTRQLLGFAKGGKYEVKSVDVNKLTDDIIGMFARTAKELEIRTRFAPESPVVSADQGQLKQVLLNLLVNAWQAMPKGGLVEVTTECILLTKNEAFPHQVASGRYVKISVKDTGTGIPPHAKERIFDPFFTTKEMGRGTGLGLASAWGIVKNHDGFIQVFSQPGEGATFEVVLPVCDDAAAAESNQSENPKRGSETILLVDDESLVRDVGAQMLETMGYTVLTAQNGREAVARFREASEVIDLVILDMIMPETTGAETFDRLRAIDPGARILLSSGYSLDGQAAEIMARGCNGFIQKPFNLERLSSKIREVLASPMPDLVERSD